MYYLLVPAPYLDHAPQVHVSIVQHSRENANLPAVLSRFLEASAGNAKRSVPEQLSLLTTSNPQLFSMGGGAAEQYRLLNSEESSDDAELQLHSFSSHKRSRQALIREAAYCTVIVLQALALLFLIWRRDPSPTSVLQCPPRGLHPLVYSPAEDLIEYEVKAFATAETITPYRGVSDEVDQAWQDLYNRTIMRIPKSVAEQLPNRTWPIADDEGYYLGQLDVFHQLHCLNAVRKSLDPDRYKDDPALGDHHIRHCVDSIRQSLMCSADISMLVWQWDENWGNVRGKTGVAHSCRNFEKIKEWALDPDRRLGHMIDYELKLDDGLPDIPIISGDGSRIG